MSSKRPTVKPRRSVKVEKKAPGKPQKAESLESQVARIGEQVEALIRRRGPVRLPDAQGEVLEKLPQMMEGLSSQIDKVGKQEALEKLPQLVGESLSSQIEQIGKEVAKSREPRRLANADRELIEGVRGEVQSLREEVNALRQTLEGIKPSVEQAVTKPSPPEDQKQEESKAG